MVSRARHQAVGLASNVAPHVEPQASAPVRRHELHRSTFAALAALLGACAAAATPPPQNAARAANVPPGSHDLTCEYASLQAAQGRNDVNRDAALFFAAFHLPDPHTPPPRNDVTFGFQQVRSRTHEYRDEVAMLPEQICGPEVAPSSRR